MQDGNYIKIFRSMLEWEWYDDINTKVLFLHMLLMANWKDGNFRGTTVPRGSFVSSIKKMSEETKLTEQEVKTAIKHLKKTKEITSKSTNKFTVFTVNNYNQYQSINQQNNKQVTNEQQTNNKLLTTIEEGKKERKEEGKKTKKRSTKVLPEKYSESEPLNQAILAFITHRKSIKAPTTEHAIDLILKKLDKMAESEQEKIDILNQSIMNGWKGIFDLKENTKPQREDKPPKQGTKFNNFPDRNYSKEDLNSFEQQILQKQNNQSVRR